SSSSSAVEQALLDLRGAGRVERLGGLPAADEDDDQQRGDGGARGRHDHARRSSSHEVIPLIGPLDGGAILCPPSWHRNVFWRVTAGVHSRAMRRRALSLVAAVLALVATVLISAGTPVLAGSG